MAFLMGFLCGVMLIISMIGCALYAPQIIAKDCQEAEE